MSERPAADDRWLPAAAERVPDTPALVVSPARVRDNVARVATAVAAAGKRLRPHVKTHKMAEVAALQLAEGAAGLQVAKLGEAESGLLGAAPDVLVGFPLVGAAKLDRLVTLARQRTTSVALDSVPVAAGISAALAGSGVRVGVLIDVDTGLHRVGVAPADAAALGDAVHALPNLDLLGVLTHEGHLPRQAAGDTGLLRELTLRAAADLRRAADSLRLPDPVVSMGCTGTWRFAAEAEGITELRPGTYVFHDLGSLAAGACGPDGIAAAVVATVVSVAPGRREFVLDAGSKSIGAERRGDSFGYLPALAAHVVRVSEEHGVVAAGDRLPEVGERCAVVPNHVCPVVNLHDEAWAIDETGPVARWRVVGRGKVR